MPLNFLMFIVYTMASFNIRNSRSLIPREQTYLLDRKLVTIQSEDRDIKHWPKSNHFEVTLPTVMENVESMRLVECNLPSAYHTFNNNYQNTKFSFTLEGKDNTQTYYPYLDGSGTLLTITIQDGFYTPDELANEIQERMNTAITELIAANGGSTIYQNMYVYFDNVGQRYWFGNTIDQFWLEFATQEDYTLTNCEQPKMWDKYTNWGLPSYIGFNKQQYASTPALDNSGNAIPIKFYYISPSSNWMTPSSTTQPVYYMQAPLSPYLLGERAIYMEIKKYNSYNELVPYSERTNDMYNNDYNGTVNSAFAKIPVLSSPISDINDSRNGFLTNVKVFDIPEEKIAKLEFKFRYHDGRLVEFDNIPFNFTIEFNQLKNEISRVYNVRIPNAYVL